MMLFFSSQVPVEGIVDQAGFCDDVIHVCLVETRASEDPIAASRVCQERSVLRSGRGDTGLPHPKPTGHSILHHSLEPVMYFES
jgi:hypothetical protein